VALEVRDSWRQFGRAGRSYEIQAQSVRLSEDRVKETELRLRAGRAETRDMLEARQSLVEAQDAVTRALVDYRLARLELARDMEILVVDEDGQLKENFEAYD
jgi:outer membrane protein TolC